MPLVIDDCVVETTTTTGTGDITLAGAITGYVTFASRCSVNDVLYYMIEAVDGSGVRTGEWETGFGTYSASGVLTRTTVHKSSNADAAVNFAAGTKRVMIALTAATIPSRGCLVKKAADLTAQNLTAASAVAWDTDVRDTHAFHDPVTNNSRITIPAGVSVRGRLRAQVTFANVTADNWTLLSIYKNGSASWTGAGRAYAESGVTTPSYSVVSAIVDLTAGDYFEVFAQVESDTSIDITAATSWFELEVID